MKRIIIAIALLLFGFIGSAQLIMNADKQIVVETDSCQLSKDVLKWFFNDSSLVILNDKAHKITAAKVIKIYELRNDDEMLMRDYVCDNGTDYTLIFWKKFDSYICITDMKKWKDGADMGDEKYAYPIK